MRRLRRGSSPEDGLHGGTSGNHRQAHALSFPGQAVVLTANSIVLEDGSHASLRSWRIRYENPIAAAQ